MINHIPEKINILYIEDDEDLCKLIETYLKRYGGDLTKFNIIVKKTLEAGIKYLKSHCLNYQDCEVDLILLDLVLPNSKGIGTFKKVKEVSNQIPIVIISGYEDIACDCVKLGAQDYLVKSALSGGLLIRSVKYAIERTKMENVYKDIIKTSPLGYHIFEVKDGDLIFSDYNKAANKILKIDHSKLINLKIKEAFPGLTDETYNKYINIATTGSNMNNEIIQYEDNDIHFGFYRVNAHRSSDKKLVVTFDDITDQVYLQEKLKASEKKYRDLVEVTGAGIYEIDFINMRFTYVNDVVCKQSGYSKEELLEMSPADFLSKDGLLKFLDRIKSLNKGDFIADATEYEVKRKDGSSLWILISAKYEEDPITENIIGANVVAIDITAQKEAELALKHKEREVYSSLENKIHQWKAEILERQVETEERLGIINNEILEMSSKSNAEGSL